MVQSCCSLNLQVRNTSQPLTPVPTPPYTRGPSHSSIVFQRRRTPSNGKMPRLWGGGCSIGPPPILKIHKNPLLWGVTCNLVWAQLWAEQASTLIAELQLPEGSATKREAGPATCAPRAGAGEENPPLQHRPRPQAASRHENSPKMPAPPARLNHTTWQLWPQNSYTFKNP